MTTEKEIIYENKILIYYDENKIYYSDELIKNKLIVDNMCTSNITYFNKFNKLVILEDQSDPPDILFIIPLNDALNNVIDMNKSEDRKKYYVSSFYDWNNDTHMDDNYVYSFAENELVCINVDSHEETYRTFEFNDFECWSASQEIDSDNNGIYVYLKDDDTNEILQKIYI
jgi:hypothetical protein